MHYKIIFIIYFIFIISCTDKSSEINYSKNFESYSNKGFALVYDDELYKKKFINKKLNDRSLLVFNNVLNKETPIRVTNLLNGKYLIAKVGDEANYPFFYNSVISKRIATDLEIDLDEPYIQILEVTEGTTFVAKKAKMFDEEKKVADKAPVDGISINDLNTSQVKEKIDKKVKYDYIVKVADFYYLKSAQTMKKKIINETSIKKVSIKEISNNYFRVFLGPFNKVELIKKVFNDMNIINFENLEVIRNEKNI